MNTTLIIFIIVASLAALVCYAFVSQALQQKQQQKERLLVGLNARADSLRQMLQGFPPHFLPRELTLLLQSGLVQVYEQLARIDPRNATYAQEARLMAQATKELQNQAEQPEKPFAAEDSKRAQDIRSALDGLYRYVYHMEGKGQLTRVQADSHRSAIKRLVLQLTADSYTAQGRTAFQQDKFRLSKHYFEQALNLLVREAERGDFQARIAQLKDRLEETEQRLSLEESESDKTPLPPERADTEWREFGQDQGSWKKKQIYD